MTQALGGGEFDFDGISPEDAFAILGNGTRLDIIRVLWRAGALHQYDDIDASDATISFSDLRRRVDIDDNGQFNYHLSKLVPHFVRKTDDGYRLSGEGRAVARTVIANSGEPSPEASSELKAVCPLCEGQLAVDYEDRWLRFSCTECDGLFGDTAPDGTILNTNLPAAGLAHRSLDDALTTGIYRCQLDLPYLMRGICRECAGQMTVTTSVCDEHRIEDGVCSTCGTPFEVWAELRCDVCRFAKRLPVEQCVMGFSPVIGFLDEAGVDVLAPALDEVVEVIQRRFQTTVTEDPFRVTVTITTDDELTLTLDEELNLLDVTR